MKALLSVIIIIAYLGCISIASAQHLSRAQKDERLLELAHTAGKMFVVTPLPVHAFPGAINVIAYCVYDQDPIPNFPKDSTQRLTGQLTVIQQLNGPALPNKIQLNFVPTEQRHDAWSLTGMSTERRQFYFFGYITNSRQNGEPSIIAFYTPFWIDAVKTESVNNEAVLSYFSRIHDDASALKVFTEIKDQPFLAYILLHCCLDQGKIMSFSTITTLMDLFKSYPEELWQIEGASLDDDNSAIREGMLMKLIKELDQPITDERLIEINMEIYTSTALRTMTVPNPYSDKFDQLFRLRGWK